MATDSYFTQRRTVRDFTDKNIDDTMLRSIIEDAMRAPTTGNMQLYSVVVTRDAERKKQLAAQHFNQPAAVGCNVILTVCADFHRFERWCEVSNAEPGYRNFQSFVAAMLDATAFTQQIITIAEMNGLGTCWLGTTTYNAPQIAELLGLPDMVVPVASLAIGYPASEPEQCERLPLEAIMHTETYHSPTDDETRRLFAVKDDFPANAKFVAENDKQSLAQVFTDIRYPRSNNEVFSKIYYDFIERQGFIWPKP